MVEIQITGSDFARMGEKKIKVFKAKLKHLMELKIPCNIKNWQQQGLDLTTISLPTLSYQSTELKLFFENPVLNKLLHEGFQKHVHCPYCQEELKIEDIIEDINTNFINYVEHVGDHWCKQMSRRSK